MIEPGWRPAAAARADGVGHDLFDALPDATVVLDAAGTIIAANARWRLFAADNDGSAATSGVGINYLDVCSKSAEAGCDDAGDVAHALRLVLTGARKEAEIEYRCPSPTVRRWFVVRVSRFTDGAGGAIVSHVNITGRKEAERSRVFDGFDPLTGAARQALAEARQGIADPSSAGSTTGVGVLLLEVTGLAAVSSTFGLAAGEEVLLAIATRLDQTVSARDSVVRTGPATFAIVVSSSDVAGLTRLAARVDTALAAPHQLHGRAVAVAGRIGNHLAVGPCEPTSDSTSEPTAAATRSGGTRAIRERPAH